MKANAADGPGRRQSAWPSSAWREPVMWGAARHGTILQCMSGQLVRARGGVLVMVILLTFL